MKSAPDYQFVQPPSRQWDLAIRLIIFVALVALIYVSIATPFFRPVFFGLEAYPWIKVIEKPSLVWLFMGCLLLTFRTLLWFAYRPTKPLSLSEAIRLTVVIPAYNEGPMVEKAIESVVQANYPHEKLEIFVIDDGSKDDTWSYITRAARKYPDLVVPIQFPKNRGKREALLEGFHRARGEVVISIDSDSVIEKSSLLAITAPFQNPRVGVVAGNVLVYNRNSGIIPRMLQVQYVLAFDLLRAVQSTYGTVYCSPGAFSAYRTEALKKVLAPWSTQTFLGVPCTYGEDRALTNFILKEGYDSVYQRTAVVRTLVPTTYSGLCKMFLRWDRTYIREELRFFRIVWSRPKHFRIAALIDSIITNLRYPVAYLSLVWLGILIVHRPFTIIRLFTAIALVTSFNMLYYLRFQRDKGFLFGILYSYFSLFGLFWIFPYACLTLRSKSWLTR